jgi:hypothetical protein
VLSCFGFLCSCCAVLPALCLLHAVWSCLCSLDCVPSRLLDLSLVTHKFVTSPLRTCEQYLGVLASLMLVVFAHLCFVSYCSGVKPSWFSLLCWCFGCWDVLACLAWHFHYLRCNALTQLPVHVCCSCLWEVVTGMCMLRLTCMSLLQDGPLGLE